MVSFPGKERVRGGIKIINVTDNWRETATQLVGVAPEELQIRQVGEVRYTPAQLVVATVKLLQIRQVGKIRYTPTQLVGHADKSFQIRQVKIR